ncbi:unnamed protein product [Darwinula stevensoni]|uniref:Uncharacterized protein n=1 Tax=Darwinula stevensoni TaxID=69355 RepID=A0A7R9AD94_9CRUS|nr:unnamed protein product [Darwinula stevensoni]CAG0900780.1 unnamed protein product [Darwinula stevensoni]
MANYLYGVVWNDKFRFKIIIEETEQDQAQSQTKEVTAYTFYWQEGFAFDYTFTLIDTSGFGGTSGIMADKEIRCKMEAFFSRRGPGSIEKLDGIGFVIQASETRLTPTQRYIFDSIQTLFGKDVEPIFRLMMTFADGQPPKALDAAKAANIPHSSIYKFNNSTVFPVRHEGEDDDDFNELFWKMGMKSFNKFFISLASTHPVALQMTKEVLEKRRKLETFINGLQPQITAEHLKKRYEDGMKGEMSAKTIIEKLQKEYDYEREQVSSMIREAHSCKKKLDEIALKPDPLSALDYIDLLIQSEIQRKQPRYL